jgi:hypothetical protein
MRPQDSCALSEEKTTRPWCDSPKDFLRYHGPAAQGELSLKLSWVKITFFSFVYSFYHMYHVRNSTRVCRMNPIFKLIEYYNWKESLKFSSHTVFTTMTWDLQTHILTLQSTDLGTDSLEKLPNNVSFAHPRTTLCLKGYNLLCSIAAQ